MVGFAPTRPRGREGRPAVRIARPPIDHRHQRRGLGDTLLAAPIAHAGTLAPRPVAPRVPAVRGNAAAIRPCEGAGLAPTGEVEDGEQVFARPPDAARLAPAPDPMESPP